MSDDTAIRAMLASLTRAWAAGDADTYAAHFTADATYIVFDGTLLTGAREIANAHRRLFDGPLKGSRLSPDPDSPDSTTIRHLTADVAHIMTSGGVTWSDRRAVEDDRVSRVTYVAVRTGGHWRLAAFQNTRRAPLGNGPG